MNVLMTGATGFVGRHVAAALRARGMSVHATRYRSASGEGITWHDAATPAGELVKASAPEIVLHAATNYGRAQGDTTSVEWVNRDWPTSLLDAAVGAGVPLFANVDTSLPPGLNAYARTKREFSAYARRRAAAGGTRVLNIALESVYGPGDDPAKFQMQLLGALLRGEAEIPLTPGDQARDYIYIDDAVDGIVRLLEHARHADGSYLVAGVGTGTPVTIRHFAEALKHATSSRSHLRFGALPHRDGELMEAKADVTVLRSIGWPQPRPIEAGLPLLVRHARGAT